MIDGRTSPLGLARAIDRLPPSHRRQARQRLVALLGATGNLPPGKVTTGELIRRMFIYLEHPDPAKMWFTLAVLRAEFPLADDVIEATRLARLDGSAVILVDALIPNLRKRWTPFAREVRVEVVVDSVIVDVTHTSTVAFATGIQRVVRQTVKRWVRDHDVILVGWNPAHTALRRLSRAEQATTVSGEKSLHSQPSTPVVLVPLRGKYILPELTLDRRTTMRLAGLAAVSSTSCTVIGFDAVPLSSSETSDFMVSGGFANNLSAVKFMDRVATISEAAALEYRGWRSMLASSGLVGPDIRAIPLPHVPPADPDLDRDEAFAALGLDPSLPLVLCVGSHEPRKNHLAIVQASDILWREGVEFQLLFVGGNAWASGFFAVKLAELARSGRPVRNAGALDDRLLAAAYTNAAFSLFPSLNEGYGLPIVESISVGTPVLTSNYGSMAEISSSRGALLVDPRDDDSIADGMRRMLTDPDVLAALRAETRSLPTRTWDDYAHEVWEYLAPDL